jgi:hypothetical protein
MFPLPVNGDSFTFLYVDDVRTSQEAHISTAVMGIVLLFYISMMFVPHRKHMFPLPVNGDNFTFLYVDDVRTSQEAHVSTACYGG